MNRSLFQAFLFLLVCSKGLLASPSSSASQLASIEPEPSVLICGCIHALTGDFLFQQPDMIVKGAQTIGISRKYYSSGPENSLEDQIVPHRMAWGFGFRDIIHLTRLLVPEPNGMIFSYLQVTPYVYQPISGGFQAGITGYLIDYLGNRYHPANNRASWPDDNTLHVKTSTGEVRVYEKRKFTNNDRECQFAFCLSKLRLANGTLIQYEYDKKNCLKRITAPSNARGKKEFSHAEVSQNKKGISIRGTDGSSLGYEYHKTATTGKKDKVKVLKYVRSSLYPSEKLKREKVSTRIAQRHFVNGRILTCEYDETGRVTQLTGPQGSLAAVGYDKGETNSFDREGNKTLYLYDPQTLRIIEIQSYQGSNHLLKTEKFTWTRFGCLERKTVLSGEGEELHTIHCTYNAHLDLTKKTISNGDESYSYSYEYNEQNLLQEESEESGRRTTYTYIENTTLPKEICNYKGDQLLKRTQYFYDDDQLLTCEITDDGATYFRKEISRKKSSPFYGMPEILSEYCGDHLIGKTRLTYDEYGNVTKTECYGSDGHLQTTTQTIYNEKGQVLKEIDPEGNTTEYRYDENGNLTWKKTPLGLEIHSIYDTANRLIEEKQIGSGQTLVTRYRDFDALDHPTKIIDPLGGITRRKYDALGNLTQETNPEGHTTQYIYDALGNVLSVTDPLGNTTITTYNLHNNPLCITHPDGNTEIYTYNPDGTKASYTNEVGRTTLYTYDIFNNISSEEIINGIKKTWTYDAFHLLQETNLDGYVTTYEYDELGRKTRETYEGRTTHYTYDSLSRVISEQTGNLRTEWTYNKLGHTTSEKVYDGSYLTLQTQTTYNAEGNPIEVTTYPNNQPAVAKTTYDVFGRVTCHTTPLGLQMKTSYQIKEGEKIITTQEIGRITQIDTYNALDQILQQERKDPFGKVLSKSEFTYDRCGNCIEEKCSIHTISTTYDNRHRKITETESGQKTTHYTYTPDSKLETQTKPDGTKLKHTYNDLGHRIALQSSKGDIHYTYSYDNRGNLLLSRDLIYQIQTKRIVDPHGEILKETLGNSHTLTSRYDELGRRTQLALPDKTISYTHLGTYLASVIIDGKTHSYTYDQSGNLIKEQHIDGSTTEYTYDADSRLIHRKHPKLDEILEYDARGNLIKLTRNGEELQYSYDYFDHLIEEPDHNYQYDILHNRIKK